MKGSKVKKLHYSSYKNGKEKRCKRLAIIIIAVLLFDMFIMPVGTFALDNENVTASENRKTAATETEAVQDGTGLLYDAPALSGSRPVPCDFR